MSASASAGSSASSAAACSGWPSVWSRRRRPASGVRAGPPSARGERDDLLGVETPQTHAMNQMVLRQTALPPGGLGRGVVARRDDDEDLVAAQPPADEHERAPGGVVDPLGVVEHDHHRSGGLQPAEHGQQLRAHRQRVRVGRRSRGEERPAQPVRHVGDELGQHPEREPGLALLAAAPQDADAGLIDEQAADERGLPDARGTAQPQDARLPGPDPVELAPHRRELADPADERAVPGHTCQFVAAWPGGEPPSPRRGVSLTHRARRAGAMSGRPGAAPSAWTTPSHPLRIARWRSEDRTMAAGFLLVERLHVDLCRLQSAALCR